MAPDASLYLDRMDLERYCAGETCELCRVDSFEELIDKLKSGRLKGGTCHHWPEWKARAFEAALAAGERMPQVPSLTVPRPTEPGLVELNDAGGGDPLLVTGNSELTQQVMLAVLSWTVSPIRLLMVDTLGHTVDMAMVFGELTADRAAQAMSSLEVSGEARIVLPGLAGPIEKELAQRLGRPVETGPLCAAELPLYMGRDWKQA